MKSKYLSFIFVILFVLSAAPNTVSPNIAALDVATAFQTADTMPFQTFNRDMNVTTFVSPDGSKDELWHFLNSAQESIYVEIYGINNPRILDLIHNLHDTKPSLDMKFLIGWNSLGYTSQNDYVANNLTDLGYDVRWTSADNFTFAHQKYVIIDNKTTIVHAGNWAKTSFPESNGKANREWSIAMTDTVVTDVYRNVFDMDWRNGTDYDPIAHGTGTPLTYSYSTSTYQEPFATAGEFSGDMKITPIFSPETSLEGILYCINSAMYTLDIQIPYFTNVGDAGSVDTIIDAILAAKARGVTVRVISEEEKDWLEIEQILISNDIPIVWHDTRWFTANHNKGIIADGKLVLVSSINYSDNSIENNREAGVIIENEDVAQWYQEIFDFDWGMADGDSMEEVNLYWSPNIPSSTDTINTTIYAHRLNGSLNLAEVRLRVKIGAGAWNNYTITDNIFDSSEDDPENYFYEISPQPDGTNITVSAHINNGTHWFDGLEMVIHVLDVVPEVDDPPTIDSPANVEYEIGDTGNAIVWHPSDSDPKNYTVTQDSAPFAQGSWDGGDIIVAIDGLGTGVYVFEMTVFDQTDKSASDSVQVTVTDTTDPSINSPADVVYVSGSSGNSITWTVSDFEPDRYTITRNGTEVANEAWDGSSISFDIDGLGVGTHIFEITIYDETGNSASDTVVVTVTPTDSQILIFIVIGAIAAIAILIFGASKRR
jgi:phosphatidylserine/phosphatidylglycerophosphate/cardiolipin synthase-like enzyme